MPDKASPATPALTSLSELGRTVLDILQTRLELLTVEFGQERARFTELVLYGGLLLVFLLLTSMLGAMIIVALFWDTPQRLPVITMVAAVPALAALGCACALIHKLRRGSSPFNATLLALRADVAALK